MTRMTREVIRATCVYPAICLAGCVGGAPSLPPPREYSAVFAVSPRARKRERDGCVCIQWGCGSRSPQPAARARVLRAGRAECVP